MHANDLHDFREMLNRVVWAHDTDDDMEFLAAMRTARRALGIRLSVPEEDEDTAVLIANGYTENGERTGG